MGVTTRSQEAGERTPLLASPPQQQEGVVVLTTISSSNNTPPESTTSSIRQQVYLFLEAKTYPGRIYQRFIVSLIGANVLAFIIGTVFVPEYNDETTRDLCTEWCDILWFGNFQHPFFFPSWLGTTSLLEIGTVLIFTLEYLLRLWTIDLENPTKYGGFLGRLRYLPTFFSLVDLASTLPFYIDAFLLTQQDLVASGFLRMFRLLRMMRVEAKYDNAMTLLDDVVKAQSAILGTAAFVGITTWLSVSSLYYILERSNMDMIYCPNCTEEDIDPQTTFIDEWGLVVNGPCEGCYNMFESIPSASYYALLNLFGEFPLADQHSVGGQIVGTITAVLAVAVFALPVGIIGNGLEDAVSQTAEGDENFGNSPIIEHGGVTEGFRADESNFVGKLYNLFHQRSSSSMAQVIDHMINALVILTAITFMVETTNTISPATSQTFNVVEFLSVVIFTLEYAARVYSIKQDPKYDGPAGRLLYMTTFLAVVDLLSVAPYWVQVSLTSGRSILYDESPSSTWNNLVKSLRLLRILRFERYTHAFTSFDDVIQRSLGVLTVTAFSAILFWVFFAAFLYLSERDNPDPEMAANYNNMPNSMWMTLLNLSGEAPLSQYSVPGKFVTAILGLFATAVFGIPIGVLGAGFEEVVEEENEDNTEELNRGTYLRSSPAPTGNSFERMCFNLVNGKGSKAASYFERMIYFFIIVTVAVGVWQTVDGQENAFHEIEWIAIVVFTVEYIIRFIGAGADPEFATGRNPITCRFHFLISFYSVIDLLAIVPFYVAYCLPNSIVNDYDEYFRMFRLLRLLKLDKYVPSISLIDDVIRLKFNALSVAFYAALSLWVLFAAGLFLSEHRDYRDELDDAVPTYGCDINCTMADRFQNFFDSMVYTGVHLTGDYPITTYSWPARFVNFFMVIAAVGVVSIPSGLIASGFVEIVQSKQNKKRGLPPGFRAGDDWYEIRYRELEGVDPPLSPFGAKIDQWQLAVDKFLNGEEQPDGHHKFTSTAYAGRVFIFTVIISNIVAVMVESVPSIDKAVGNEKGNFFDVFEMFSVMVFATEYILRLFCAPKNRDALYSSWVYATTFFGIVDFLSTAPWFVQQLLMSYGYLDSDAARIFRIFRIFRILQLEDFVTAFRKLDNVFRASKDVLKATGLMAVIIWVGCGALFYIFEENNPNWRTCDDGIPLHTKHGKGCFDFASTAACNEVYPESCHQSVFVNMPNSLYLTAVFLGGEWAVVDFTWPGRFVCLFLCVVGIGLYAIPIGSLFDSFGAVLGMGGDDEEEEED